MPQGLLGCGVPTTGSGSGLVENLGESMVVEVLDIGEDNGPNAEDGVSVYGNGCEITGDTGVSRDESCPGDDAGSDRELKVK